MSVTRELVSSEEEWEGQVEDKGLIRAKQLQVQTISNWAGRQNSAEEQSK